MNSTDQERREECRRAVRAYLAARPAVAQKAATITRGLAIEFDFSAEEVEAALAFLHGLDQVSKAPDSLGATEYFQITATGTLEAERDA